jgi:hypothetical protein
MRGQNGFTTTRPRLRGRVLALSTALLALSAVAPSVAAATLRTHNVNDPAGDLTPMTYRLSGGTFSQDFQLAGDEDRSFGPAAGVYTIQAFPAPGWRVGDIQCVGASPSVFQIDVPNGRVTVNHTAVAEDTCTFTNRRVGASGATGGGSGGGGASSTPGVAPTPTAAELPKVSVPKKIALLKVNAGRRFASATVRIPQRSVIKASLLRGTKVLQTARVVKAAGSPTIRINLNRANLRLLRRQGSTARLTLRVVVVPVGKKTGQVFRFGVRIKL